MTWRVLRGPPVPPREDALLFPSADSSLLLFGGRREGQVFDDLWRFDAGRWHQVTSAGGPGAIEHGAGAYDPIRRRVVVFGGAVGGAFSDRTYEWDGSRWHTFDVPGPAPRVGHSMVWSPADGGVLLYGGFAAEQFRDLWKWDGGRWQRLSENGPSYTEGHVLAAADSAVYVVGPGLDASETVRVWRWKDGEFTVQGVAGPPLRVGATATYHHRRRVLIYWGGSDPAGRPASTIHEFDGVRWNLRGSR